MSPVQFRTATWIRVAGVCAVALWWYLFIVRGNYRLDSVLNVAMFIPIAAWFTYVTAVQMMFLFRGNPPTVEITDTTVVVRNGWTTKVFDRATLRLNTVRGLTTSLMLRDAHNKAVISPSLFDTKQFAEINELLWEANR